MKQGFKLNSRLIYWRSGLLPFREKNVSRWREEAPELYIFFWGGGQGKGSKSLYFEWNKQTHPKSRANIPRAADQVHADVWRQRELLPCKSKTKWREELCVPAQFQLCITTKSFYSHRQTQNALGKPGIPVLDHLRTENCLFIKNSLQLLFDIYGDGLGLCDVFCVETVMLSAHLALASTW